MKNYWVQKSFVWYFNEKYLRETAKYIQDYMKSRNKKYNQFATDEITDELVDFTLKKIKKHNEPSSKPFNYVSKPFNYVSKPFNYVSTIMISFLQHLDRQRYLNNHEKPLDTKTKTKTKL